MFSKLKQLFRSSPSTPPPLSSLEFADLNFHEELGRGGYGVVHRVTFKTPRPGLTQAAAKQLHVENIKEEVNILKTLDHPNIVKLYGCLAGPASLYFILLEYASKGTVSSYLKRNQGWPISIQLLKKWTRESALALQYLHHIRVLHRDVKASNCLLFEGDLLKLSDFGLSREMEASETTSTAKGTWRYMAPEINTDNHFSFKSDIYAYGMLVLEIGTGKVPFEGLESFNVMYRVGAENLKPTIPLYFPDTLADFIWRCWNPTPKYRPPLIDALEVIDGLPDDSDTSQGESASSAVHHAKQWGFVTEFGKKGDAEGEFQFASRVAVCSNGDMVVVDCPNWVGIPVEKRPPRRVFIFTSNGKFKLTLNPPEDQPEACLLSPVDVAITSHNQIAVTDSESKYVKLFNETGAYLHSFSVLSDNDDPNTKVQPSSISVACNGDILVSYVARNVITIHEPHGRLTNTVKLSITPYYITTNSKQQIIVCDLKVRKVQILSYAGDVVVSLDSFHVDGKPGRPTGVTCSEHGEDDCIFIAVRKFDPATGNAYAGTGHIHQYSPGGRFVRCIISGMHRPLGITWQNNAIYVANWKSVLVYSQK